MWGLRAVATCSHSPTKMCSHLHGCSGTVGIHRSQKIICLCAQVCHHLFLVASVIVLGGKVLPTWSEAGPLPGTSAALWAVPPDGKAITQGLRAALTYSHSHAEVCSHPRGHSGTVGTPARRAVACLHRAARGWRVLTYLHYLPRGSPSTFRCIAAWVSQASCCAVWVSSVDQ